MSSDMQLQINVRKPQEKIIEVRPIPNKEEGFSSKKYFSTALALGGVAAAIYSFCFPLSMGLCAAASWSIWSGASIEANRAAEGTRLEKPIHQLHAITTDVNSLIAAGALFPLTLFDRYHRPAGDLNGRPILLINGYISFGSTWDYQRKKLAESGLGPIYTMNVGTGRSIKTYAKQVQEKVSQIQKETNRNDVILICHSKGGLVGSYYATHLADTRKTKVTDVVTIGTPLAGTPLGYVGCGLDAYEMRTDSEFHRELREKIKEHPEIRFSHIASETDEVVSLSSALQGEDRSRHLVLKDIGHVGLIFSSRVADQICAWLK